MSRKPVTLITGASGEIGHGLIDRLAGNPDRPIITLDLSPLAPELAAKVRQQFLGSVLDGNLLDRILAEYEIDLFVALRDLMMEARRLTLLITSHAPLATLLPQDHPLSAMEIKTVELKGRP